MKINKKHKVFLTQLATAIIVFIGINFVLKFSFYQQPSADNYIVAGQGAAEMTKNSNQILQELIDAGEVTFDPTNGRKFAKVLKELKPKGDKAAITFVGSSQLRTVIDRNGSDSYLNLATNLIKQSLPETETYNVALGGMTAVEKKIIADVVTKKLEPEHLVVGITPWDSVSDELRSEINAVNDNQSEFIKRGATNVKSKSGEGSGFINDLNKSITDYSYGVFKNSFLVGKQTALRLWLNDLAGLIYNTDSSTKKYIDEQIKLPYGWITLGQELTNETGWVNEGYSGSRALKIENSSDKERAKWYSEPLTVAEGTKTLFIECWNKLENVSSKSRLVGLDLKIKFVDGTEQWYYDNLLFGKGTHDWERTSVIKTFDKEIATVMPHILFYNGSGELWVDDLRINTVNPDGTLGDNIVPNSSFEKNRYEVRVSDDTVDRKAKLSKDIPAYWITYNQKLSDTTGWDNQFFSEGERSLKILKVESRNTRWTGDKIDLPQPEHNFEIAIDVKTESVSMDTKLFAFDIKFIFDDGTEQWFYEGLEFSRGTSDWNTINQSHSFDKKVVAFVPNIIFNGGTGTAWFDNVVVGSRDSAGTLVNFVKNPGAEEVLTERVNVFYEYTKEQWKKIYENSRSVVDNLSSISTSNNTKSYILMMPFWKEDDKSAYPQQVEYQEYLRRLSAYCNNKGVQFIDASDILSSDNFGVYKRGSNINKIDVLHFDANGHDKLSRVLINKLKL